MFRAVTFIPYFTARRGSSAVLPKGELREYLLPLVRQRQGRREAALVLNDGSLVHGAWWELKWVHRGKGLSKVTRKVRSGDGAADPLPGMSLHSPDPKTPAARSNVGQWVSSFFWGFSDGPRLLAVVLLQYFPFGSSSARDNR